MTDKTKNRQGGFVELIIVIIIALLVMRYFGITISGTINWVLALFRSVLR